MKKMIALVIALMTVLTLMIPVFASAEEKPVAANTTMWVNTADGKNLNVRTEPNRTTRTE